ncbi:hypothetical protein ACH6CV_08835 [Bacillota bacterium Meth-B3]|nr:hypothetical protein [Christensenellaceae bacterium]MEA5066398.1 hypothetical protein [Eubacteriales bacterium]
MAASSKDGNWSAGLPYIDNIPIILLTAIINLAVAFIFYYGRSLTLGGILADAGICGITTSLIDVFIVRFMVGRLRAQGRLPREAPQSRLMQKLPKHPLPLALVFGAVFAMLAPLFNAFVIRFFHIEAFTFARFAVWRVIYTTLLSAKIVELAILRYVQPDCARASDAQQKGAQPVKNPLPRMSTFKEWFDTVRNDFGLNMLLGLALGGTIIRDQHVVIPPTTRAGIVISASILGAIVTVSMAYPIARNMRAARTAGALPVAQAENRWVGWMPASPALFALTLLVPIMIVAALAFWAVFTFFGFEDMNFFQYFVIRLLFTTLLTKPTVNLAILRYTQPNADRKKGIEANV